jgi:hypothetical protein
VELANHLLFFYVQHGATSDGRCSCHANREPQ